MANRQKISQMTPKGANLAATDLLEISEASGTGFITKSITGQEIINAGGGGGGSQDLQQVTDIGATTTNAITITNNGSTDTLTVNHTSGSGKGVLITKGGNGEGLKIDKTSGSGNAATIIGTLEATTIVKTGGTAAQFLMADGSITSNLLTALGFFSFNRVAESTAVTGTTVETIIENITIPANTFANGGILRLYNLKVRKVGANGITTAMRIYIGPNSNNLSGATQIGVLSSALFSGVLFFEMLRTFTCTTSNLLGFSFAASSNTDTINSTIQRGSVVVNWTIPQFIIITIQAASVLDSYTLIGASAKNF